MSIRLYGIVCFLIALAACSTNTYWQGDKPGATQADFSRDFLDCRFVSKRLKGRDDDETIKQCLQARGWAVTMTHDR